jgi:hypothetical protein
MCHAPTWTSLFSSTGNTRTPQHDATGRAAAEAFASWWSKTRRIERRHVVRREFKIRSPSETFHLHDAGGASDRRSDAVARHEPSQRDLRRFGLMPGRSK